MNPVRVLLVDDSGTNREMLANHLKSIGGVELVGQAFDGEQALKLVAALHPDLITLDLEMPRMDGFTFLRLLMARRPTPVIVVSSHAGKENVFRALELGALDFIPRPVTSDAKSQEVMRKDLLDKVSIVRQLSPSALTRSRVRETFSKVMNTKTAPAAPQASVAPPRAGLEKLIVIGSSTGGPTALMDLFGKFPPQPNAAIVVAQHMPERFTKTFAERLNRVGHFRVVEASGQHVLRAGDAWICPGGRCVEITRSGGDLIVQVVPKKPTDRYVPSVDRLFSSAALAGREKVTAVVLTGMGDDGARSMGVVKENQGATLVEAEDSAAIFGMPGAALRTGHVDESLPLPAIARKLGQLMT